MRTRTDLIYHGTTSHYVKGQIKRFGRYQHVPTESFQGTDDNHRVYLTVNPNNGINFARQRSQEYASFPVLLVVKTELILPESRLTWEPFLGCDFLERGWYRILGIRLKRKQVKDETWEELKELEQEVLRL